MPAQRQKWSAPTHTAAKQTLTPLCALRRVPVRTEKQRGLNPGRRRTGGDPLRPDRSPGRTGAAGGLRLGRRRHHAPAAVDGYFNVSGRLRVEPADTGPMTPDPEWWVRFGDPGGRQVFGHIRDHGSITETELNRHPRLSPEGEPWLLKTTRPKRPSPCGSRPRQRANNMLRNEGWWDSANATSNIYLNGSGRGGAGTGAGSLSRRHREKRR